MNLKLLVILCLYGALIVPSGGFLQEAKGVITIVKIGLKLAGIFSKLWDDTDIFQKTKEQDILQSFGHISQKLDMMEANMGTFQQTMATLVKSLPQVVHLEVQHNTLDSYLRPVLDIYSKYVYYLEHQDQVEKYTLENFAQTTISSDTHSVLNLLSYIHDMTAPTLRSLKKTVIKSGSYMCDLPQSPHQVMYNLFNLISLTEIKGYTMMQFSWMLLKLYKKGNFTLEVHLAEHIFKERVQEKLDALQSILPELSTELWRCDPNEHKEGETYVRLTQFLQGYIENEVDLNSAATCNYNCPYYSYVASSAGCYQNMFCSKQRRCKGRIFNCDFKDSDSWVCMSDKSDRRYDWIEYENGMVFGKKTHCSNKIKVDSWWRWVFWHCSYCFCICDEIGPNSDRYFSLRAVRADVENNKIVTGVRFIKHNRIIHIQIQEGTALPEGTVNESTVAWKPVEDLRPENTNLINGNDIMMLSWEERAIDTDDLHAPKNHVITGVKFRNVGGHLNLELEVTPINFATGKISPLQSIWIGNDNTPASLNNPRKKVEFTYPDIPTHSPQRSEPDTQHDQYVEFTWTSATSDVSQSTIPFMDAQPVSPEPHTWLTGAGVFHKGQSGYGGFMALKVNTIDFTPYLTISEFKPGTLDRNSLHGSDKEPAAV